MDQEQDQKVSSKSVWFDIVDCEMVLISIFIFLPVLGDGDKRSIEVSSITDASKKERVCRVLLSREFSVKLRSCTIMAEIIVFSGFGAS